MLCTIIFFRDCIITGKQVIQNASAYFSSYKFSILYKSNKIRKEISQLSSQALQSFEEVIKARWIEIFTLDLQSVSITL